MSKRSGEAKRGRAEGQTEAQWLRPAVALAVAQWLRRAVAPWFRAGAQWLLPAVALWLWLAVAQWLWPTVALRLWGRSESGSPRRAVLGSLVGGQARQFAPGRSWGAWARPPRRFGSGFPVRLTSAGCTTASPTPARAELFAHTFGGEAEQLPQNPSSLLVDSTSCFEYHRCENVRLPSESLVILSRLLGSSVDVTGTGQSNPCWSQRADPRTADSRPFPS